MTEATEKLCVARPPFRTGKCGLPESDPIHTPNRRLYTSEHRFESGD